MTIAHDTIIALLTKVDADAHSVVVSLREVYGKSEPLLNLLITQELEAAVHLSRHIHSILEGIKLEKALNQ